MTGGFVCARLRAGIGVIDGEVWEVSLRGDPLFMVTNTKYVGILIE